MNRRFPLQSILDLSQLRLDEATRRLGELIAGEQEAAQRLEMLVQYREEYELRFREAVKQGMGPDTWRNYQGFMDRLDAAVTQARELVAASRQRTTRGQKEWLDKRGRVQAFDTLAQRHRARLSQAESKREQKATDEHAARRHGKDLEDEPEPH